MIAAKSSVSLFLTRGSPLSFGAFRTYALLTCTLGEFARVCHVHVCIRVRVYVRGGGVGARARASVRALTKLAKYAPLGEARTEAASRPSLSDSPAYRVAVVVSLSTVPRRTAPLRATLSRRQVSAAGKTVGGREDNAEVSWRSSGAIFRTSRLILWPGNRIDRRSLWEYPARLSRFSNLWGNCGRTYVSWTLPYGICSSP